MGERELGVRLFTRTTRITDTDEGLQQANISVFIYDGCDIAYEYFKDFMSQEEWYEQLDKGEGFYLVKGNGYVNTVFLETREI